MDQTGVESRFRGIRMNTDRIEILKTGKDTELDATHIFTDDMRIQARRQNQRERVRERESERERY